MKFPKHFELLMDMVRNDFGVKPGHVSIYLALLHQWSREGYENPMHIDCVEIGILGKVKTVTQCTEYLKDLRAWGYIRYRSPRGESEEGTVHMYDFKDAPATREISLEEYLKKLKKERKRSNAKKQKGGVKSNT